jgi:hypothetical protein
MFIDQLAMIQEKTRGNLTNEETTVLRNALSNLQMAYVEVARAQERGGASQPAPVPEPATSAEPSVPAQTSTPPELSTPATSAESESKKKFTKSYGP